MTETKPVAVPMVSIAFRHSVLFGRPARRPLTRPRARSLHCLSAFRPLRTGGYNVKVINELDCLHCLSAFRPLRTWIFFGNRSNSSRTSPLPFGIPSSSDSVQFSKIIQSGLCLHCLSAFRPLRTAGGPNPPHGAALPVSIAFRHSVLFGPHPCNSLCCRGASFDWSARSEIE